MAWFRAFLLGILLLWPLAPKAVAADLAPPAGTVILTVAGKIALTNAPDGQARLDLAQLLALPSRTIETTTPWTEGVQSFTGVAVAELLKYLGADGVRLHATATNAYEVDFPVTDATNHDGIIAYLQNGSPLADDKGPLWIVFPYDSDPALLGDRFQNASIWNLATLTLH